MVIGGYRNNKGWIQPGYFIQSILAIFLLIGNFSTIFAALPTPSSLSLPGLVHIAIAHNKDLQAARHNVAIAQTRLAQAGLWPNPSLTLSNTDDRFFSHEGEYTRSAGFTQEFPVAGRIGAQQQVARVDVAIAKTEIREAERKLQNNVASSYYTLILINQRIALDNRLLSNTQQLVQATHNRLHAGEVSIIDANTAQLEYQRLLQEKNSLVGQRRNQMALLNLLLGRPAFSPLALYETLPRLQALPSLNTLQQLALRYRPDFATLLLKLNRSCANVLLARSQRFADWTLGVSVEQNLQVVEGAPPQTPTKALTLNVAIPLPLLNTGSAKIEEANRAGTQAYTELAAQRLAIQNEVAGNYAQTQTLSHSLFQAQQHLLPLGTRNLQIAKKAYQNGQLSLLDVIQTQRQQNDAEVSYLNALNQYCQAWVKLENSVGISLYSLTSTHQLGKGA